MRVPVEEAQRERLQVTEEIAAQGAHHTLRDARHHHALPDLRQPRAQVGTQHHQNDTDQPHQVTRCDEPVDGKSHQVRREQVQERAHEHQGKHDPQHPVVWP